MGRGRPTAMALRTSTLGGLELAGLFARALSRTRVSAAAPAAAAACSANVGGLSSAHGEHRRTFVTLPKLPFKLEDGMNAIGTFLDGKIAEAKYIHPYMFKQAELVGEDYNGNKYYEIKKGVLYGRHRWFVPKDIYDYSPASVPPEWHGWLHNINDDAPSRVKFLEPTYKTAATSYKYLGYQPKGSYRKKLEFGKKKRNWKKYEAWTPPQ